MASVPRLQCSVAWMHSLSSCLPALVYWPVMARFGSDWLDTQQCHGVLGQYCNDLSHRPMFNQQGIALRNQSGLIAGEGVCNASVQSMASWLIGLRICSDLFPVSLNQRGSLKNQSADCARQLFPSARSCLRMCRGGRESITRALEPRHSSH